MLLSIISTVRIKIGSWRGAENCFRYLSNVWNIVRNKNKIDTFISICLEREIQTFGKQLKKRYLTYRRIKQQGVFLKIYYHQLYTLNFICFHCTKLSQLTPIHFIRAAVSHVRGIVSYFPKIYKCFRPSEILEIWVRQSGRRCKQGSTPPQNHHQD